MNIKKMGFAFSAVFLLGSVNSYATSYYAPSPGDSLVGQIQYTSSSSRDTAATIGQRYDVGFNAIAKANPHLSLSQNLPSGAPLKIPTQHLLPNTSRQGIVINLPEMRMYYYPRGTSAVYTYPIGIGKVGKTIPITRTYITRKTVNPTWIPPEDIREFNLQQGIVLPQVMPPGPDNPLGPYAIYMGVPTYLIHSTIFPQSVGKRASFGCIRMYESDIKSFFPSVTGGIPVAIINTPTKVGWQNNRVYVEAHKPLEEHSSAYDASLAGMVHMVHSSTRNQPVLVDWQAVSFIAEERDGLPHEVGIRLR